MTCRVALLRMHEQSLITLPASRIAAVRRWPDFPATPASDPQCALLLPVHEIAALMLRLVATAPVLRLRNKTIQRYHYLGYTAMPGSQLRYKVYAGDQLVALLSFGASAWTLVARDNFIGWHTTQRLINLHRVVNNARFLILAWIQCKGRASEILSIVHRQPPTAHRLAAPPSLQAGAARNPRRVRAALRRRGNSYRAANWIHVGKTAGRGQEPRGHAQIIPVKDIWLYPLRRNFRAAR